MLETFESTLLELGPHPGFPFASEQVEGGDDVGKVRDEFPVEICKPGKQPDSFDRGGGLPFCYGFQLPS